MALINVAGTQLGITASQPVGITALSTKADIVAAHEALTYTTTGSCLITQLPQPQRDWSTGTDPTTVCPNQDTSALTKQFKIARQAANPNIAALMDYADAFIAVVFALQESSDQIGTYEIIHPNGVDKVWGQIQVKSVTVDPTDNESRVLFNSEWFYEAWPVFSAI